MTAASPTNVPAAATRLPSPWLFPATYALHATEEYCCGETFPVWISRLAHVDFDATAFLWLNGVAMVLMLGAAWLASRTTNTRWLATTLAVVVTINGTAHLVASAVTASYSPGVVTGTTMWLPLGALTLRRAFRMLARHEFVRGAVLGAIAHAAVSGIVLAS